MSTLRAQLRTSLRACDQSASLFLRATTTPLRPALSPMAAAWHGLLTSKVSPRRLPPTNKAMYGSAGSHPEPLSRLPPTRCTFGALAAVSDSSPKSIAQARYLSSSPRSRTPSLSLRWPPTAACSPLEAPCPRIFRSFTRLKTSRPQALRHCSKLLTEGGHGAPHTQRCLATH